MDTENRLTAVRGEGLGGWVRRLKRLSKKKGGGLMGTDKSMVVAKGKR